MRALSILIIITYYLFGAIETNSSIAKQLVVPFSSYYIDYSKKATIDEIKHKKFRKTDSKVLRFGYSPNFNVWIKFSIKNNSNHHITKILEYKSPLTSYIELYENGKLIDKKGLLYKNNKYGTNPTFYIHFKPNETKTYYIKSSSVITVLKVYLELLNIDEFFKKEQKKISILMLFFGAIGMLILYNFIIFIIVRDKVYIYYVLFFLSWSIHLSIYSQFQAIANLFLEPNVINFLLQYIGLILVMPIIFLVLFTKEVLSIKTKYPKINKSLNIILTISVVVAYFLYRFNLNNAVTFSILVVVIGSLFITFFTLLRKERYVGYLIIGWLLYLSANASLYMHSLRFFSIFKYLPYYIESVVLLNTIILSLILAHRIKNIEVEKSNKDILLKELNHRVKNNILTILSFIRLKKFKSEDAKIKELLTDMEHRIISIEKIHYLLKELEQKDINAYEYFKDIIDNLLATYSLGNIKANIKTDVHLPFNVALYCGFIINEAVTNSLKYAFSKECKECLIDISLKESSNEYILSIKDNGKGFKKQASKGSLGFTIIETIATKQLRGKSEIEVNGGVLITIRWRKNGKNDK